MNVYLAEGETELNKSPYLSDFFAGVVTNCSLIRFTDKQLHLAFL